MKIPSPGPLDDRGVLCEDKYRILLNNVKGGLIIFLREWDLFIPLWAVAKKTDFSVDLFYTLCRGLLVGKKKNQLFSWFLYTLDGLKKRAQLALSSFYTPKRFRTAVAGMKIPSPGPLDDRGVLCAPNIDVYRKLSRVFV